MKKYKITVVNSEFFQEGTSIDNALSRFCFDVKNIKKVTIEEVVSPEESALDEAIATMEKLLADIKKIKTVHRTPEDGC